jgi:hypothetical protein
MNARMMLRAGIAVIAVAGTMVIGPSAMAAPAEVVHEHGVTETFVDTITCSDEPNAEITVTYNSVEKTSTTPDGGEHSTFTESGTFTAVPLDGSQSATGHFAVWGGFNDNGTTVDGTFTLNIQGTYEDGTTLSVHAVDHFNTTPGGAEFFFTKCRD